MTFSANEAAFEGFRIVRREPLTILAWGLVHLVVNAGSVVLFMPLMAPFLAATQAEQASPDMPHVMQMVEAMGRFYAIALPVGLIVAAVFTCAVYRAILRPQEKSFARLRLGGDELRMLGLWILMGLLWIACCIPVFAVLAIALGVVGALTKGAGIAAGFLFVAVLYIVMLGLLVWLGVRLSLAAPMTFVQQKVRLFSSWKLTKGRFWSLFGCYLLAFVFIVILGLVGLTIYGALSVMATGSISAAAQSMFRPDISSLQAYFSPSRSVYLVFAALLGAVYYAVGIAPAAAAFRALTETSPDRRAEVFD